MIKIVLADAEDSAHRWQVILWASLLTPTGTDLTTAISLPYEGE